MPELKCRAVSLSLIRPKGSMADMCWEMRVPAICISVGVCGVQAPSLFAEKGEAELADGFPSVEN